MKGMMIRPAAVDVVLVLVLLIIIIIVCPTY